MLLIFQVILIFSFYAVDYSAVFGRSRVDRFDVRLDHIKSNAMSKNCLDSPSQSGDTTLNRQSYILFHNRYIGQSCF
jgi:hypothetical protein